MKVRTPLIASATIAAVITILAPSAFAVIDLPRDTYPVFQWEPASGLVHGYAVYSYCNGNDDPTTQFSFENSARIHPDNCDTLVVRVAAWQFGPDGGEGPLSEPSETIRFVDEDEGEPPEAGDGGAAPPPDGTGVLLDFDGMGAANILAQNAYTGQLQLWTLEEYQAVLSSTLPSLPIAASVVGNGDMDGDGNADLLYLDHETNELAVWLIAGGAVVGGGVIAELASNWDVVGNADHDGDGRADVLLHHGTTGELELWTMNGPEILEADLLSRAQQAEWRLAATGDYDGDGRADLLWHDPDAGRIEIWLMDERTVVTNTEISLDLASPWSIVAAGDFDLDGQGDIVWHSEATGEVGMCFLAAGGLRSQSVLEAKLRPSADIVGAADYDGDGLLDLLVHLNGHRGTLLARFMNGSEVLDATRIGVLPHPWFVASVGELSPVR